MAMLEAGRKQREVEANLPMKVFGTGGRSVGVRLSLPLCFREGMPPVVGLFNWTPLFVFWVL